jgi:hypothetical protein
MSNLSAPAMIDTADINFATLDSFKFKSAGCGRVDTGSKLNLLLLLLAPLMLLGLKVQAKRQLTRERARLRA